MSTVLSSTRTHRGFVVCQAAQSCVIHLKVALPDGFDLRWPVLTLSPPSGIAMRIAHRHASKWGRACHHQAGRDPARKLKYFQRDRTRSFLVRLKRDCAALDAPRRSMLLDALDT